MRRRVRSRGENHEVRMMCKGLLANPKVEEVVDAATQDV